MEKGDGTDKGGEKGEEKRRTPGGKSIGSRGRELKRGRKEGIKQKGGGMKHP